MKKKGKPLNISNKVKFRKPSKKTTNVVINQLTFKSTKSNKADYLVQSASNGMLTAGQIEAMRVALRRPIKHIKKSRVIPLHKPRLIVTKRSSETRMGRGKGSPAAQIALVQKGQILYEIYGPGAIRAFNVFSRCIKKLPVRLKLIDLKHGKIA